MLLGLYTRMQALVSTTRQRMTREDGAVATEYALLIALVAIAIIAALIALGSAIAGKFGDASKALK